jgi:hypothetical protein
MGIYEALTVTPTIQKLIMTNATSEEIQNEAMKAGMMTMQLDGLIKAMLGLTSASRKSCASRENNTMARFYILRPQTKTTSASPASSKPQISRLHKHTLRERKLKPVHLSEEKTNSLAKLSLGGKKVKLRDMVIFTRQLATMINAGVPLVRSLATLQKQTEKRSFQAKRLAP